MNDLKVVGVISRKNRIKKGRLLRIGKNNFLKTVSIKLNSLPIVEVLYQKLFCSIIAYMYYDSLKYFYGFIPT